ncbi:unnamed protein product [Brachionus calyciflorus]|uniref:RING-type domain-containing protein n=1 Tax=Brachionus calyciflorus TaxID=104777 RepID=A0A814JWE4_9BILA|nr:unnamed protein product [Brachionus calyciflorus]
MSDRRRQCDDNQNDSIGAKLVKAITLGAAVGLGAFLGYQLYKHLTAEEVEKIPITNATFSDKSLDCSICLESFNYDDKLKVLPCNHKYHAECIIQWVEKNPSCPQCRRSC